jgi:hypothetical protein
MPALIRRVQVIEIAGSIREFGFTNPVLVGEDGTLIAGHGCVLAARNLGLTEVPAIVLTGLTKTHRRALTLADNRLALNAGWDRDLLALEIGDLQEAGFDLGLTGFSGDEIADLRRPVDESDSREGETTDAIPDPVADPVVQSGDLWLLASIGCSAATAPIRPMWPASWRARRRRCVSPARPMPCSATTRRAASAIGTR